jgi:CHAT domain-containing protein/tetratricopeptide (TPR) repeat protein
LETHLSDDNIEELLRDGPSGEQGLGIGQEVRNDLLIHLHFCEICRSKVKAQETSMQRLGLLGHTAPDKPGPECPSDGVWLELAGGVMVANTESYLSHAANCDHCGPLLQQAVADLQEDLTPDEEAAIAELRSSSRGWQNTLARRLNNAAVSDKDISSPSERWLSRQFASLSLPKLAVAATIAGLMAMGIWFAFHLEKARSPEGLIAEAYAEKRTLEVRIEGAPYVPLRQQRGANSEQGRMDRPALLKAEAEIAQKLQSYPNDVRWIEASGRASLLEDDQSGADAAIQALEKAQRLAPDNTSVSIDRASAYLLRGQFLDRTEDYGQAIQILGAVLASHRGGETAQFNYAIALEKHLLKRQAAQAWQAFLTQYPNSAWVSDAEDHLRSLKQEIGDQQSRSESPLKTLEQVATAFQMHDDHQIGQIDARIEEYQEFAIQNWLPTFFSAEDTEDKKVIDSSRALNGLAELLIERHKDAWLNDLLHADRRSPAVRQAVHLLADSVSKIETSDDSLAQNEASKALSLFRDSQVISGEKRAQLVLVLAQQYEHRDAPCESMAQALLRDPSLKRYAWILAQVQLEDGFCASVSDWQALQAAQFGFQIAQAHRFPILILRATATETGLYSALGDTHRAWTAAATGLRTFWSGSYPKLRGYNALALMDEVNYPLDKWFLEAAILSEAMPLVDGDPRTSMVAVEQARLGQTLMRIGDLDGAAKSYQQAESLLARSAPGPQRDALSAESELGFAKVDLNRSQLEASLSRLARIRPALSEIPDDLLASDFFETSGIAEFRSNHSIEAEKDLDAAIQLAEKGLRQVDTEEDRWKWSHQHERLYRTLVELKLQNDPTQALVDWEWYKAAALRGGNSPASRQLRDQDGLPMAGDKLLAFPGLADGTALVSFAVFPRGYAVWVWNQGEMKEKWVPLEESELSSQVMKFTEECSDPRSDASGLFKEGAMLYRELVLPIEPWISGRRQLVLEPDDVLRALPIGLLVDSDGEYLGDRFAITVSPGIAYLNRSRKWSGISPASNALVLGDPSVPGWVPLPDAAQEAKAVASSFNHPRLVMQDTVSHVDLPHEIEQADIFHFSGHAQASVESAGLVAGNQRMFGTAQLDAVSRSGLQIVVLSACSSSRGTGGFFDDDDSIVRRIMGARVPEVVASGWMVDSASTAVLMKAFYSDLLRGESPSEALKFAERSVRFKPEFSHPYYWAGFSVFGRS